MRNKLDKVNRFFGQHTFLAAIVMMFIVLLTRAGVSYMMNMLPAVQTDPEVHTVAITIVYFVIPLAFAIAFGYGWIFSKGKFFKTMGLGTMLVLLAMLQFVACLGMLFMTNPDVDFVDSAHATGGFVYILGIGFFEEVVFRGIVANKLGWKYGTDNKGVWKAAILSAALFGVVHMQNLFFGVSLIPALVQSVVAMATGLLMTAIYFRGGNIFAMILLHAMIDFGPLFASIFTTQGAVASDAINAMSPKGLLVVCPMALMALFLMRSSKMPVIIENLQKGYPRVSEIKRSGTTLRQKINRFRSGDSKGLMLQV